MTIKPDPYLALRIPDFRFFVGMRFFITLALQIQGVVVAWQVYALTHDPFSLGLIGLAEAIPAIVVALYAGHVADNFERKKVILVSLFTLLCCSIGLLLITFQSEGGLAVLLPIYVIIGLTGFARGFLGPAIFALMPQLIKKEDFSNAVTWNSTFWQTAAVVGPAAGGLIFGSLGLITTYSINIILIGAAFILLLFIPNKPLPPKVSTTSLGESLKEGLSFVFKDQIILSAISLDLFAVLFGGAVALLPIFASDILLVGPMGLGFLRAAPSVGAVVMGGLVLFFPVKKHAGKILLASVAAFGGTMIGFGLSTSFYLSLFLLFLSGIFDAVSVIVRSTLIQTHTPEHLKGRVASVNNIFIGSSNEIGSFESGLAAKIMGIVPSVIFGGSMTILVVIITALKAKRLTKLHM
jgi:MFS family permease